MNNNEKSEPNKLEEINEKNKQYELEVIYEDNHIIVVKKQPNIPSQADKTEDIDILTLIKKYIKEKFDKTSKSASRLSDQGREKIFKKKYLAVVDGKFEKQTGVLEDYLYKDERNNISKVVNKDKKNAKLAKLDYEVLAYNEVKNLSLVKVNLHTGRHHQIRVQLANSGHSIFGDQKYGTRGKGKQIALWAYELTIQHPITKKEMTFKCLPESNGTWCILKDVKNL